jgi:hypothetical protein
MKIDYKNLKPIVKGEVKMQDPARFPKIILSLEKSMKDSYQLQCNKMLVDITKKLVSWKQ